MKDPLLSLVKFKSLEEIIAAAKETIRRHRRRFIQRNLRPCPNNCKGADMVGHKVMGCEICGSQNPEVCIKQNGFVPLFSKEELAQQFADQLRNPDALLREYRDITVFLWVLGAFDKQNKILDERIVSKVEQSEKPGINVAVVSGNDRRDGVGFYDAGSDDKTAVNGNESTAQRDHRRPTQASPMRHRIITRTATPAVAKNR